MGTSTSGLYCTRVPGRACWIHGGQHYYSKGKDTFDHQKNVHAHEIRDCGAECILVGEWPFRIGRSGTCCICAETFARVGPPALVPGSFWLNMLPTIPQWDDVVMTEEQISLPVKRPRPVNDEVYAWSSLSKQHLYSDDPSMIDANVQSMIHFLCAELSDVFLPGYVLPVGDNPAAPCIAEYRRNSSASLSNST